MVEVYSFNFFLDGKQYGNVCFVML